MRAGLLALALISGPVHAQSLTDIYAQRASALALDDRCALFTPTERQALQSAYLQVRGDLLRAGYTAREVDTTYSQLSRNVSGQPCDDSSTQQTALTIASAFSAWQQLRQQEFAGAPRFWTANRATAYPSWTIVQQLGPEAAPYLFGLHGVGQDQALTLALPPERAAASLALSYRDPELTPGLHDPSLGGLLSIDDAPEWTRYLPPFANAERFYPAGHETGESLIYYRFSEHALEALTQLDPREAIRIDGYDQSGNRIFSDYVGVGDFAAALAFVRSSPELASLR